MTDKAEATGDMEQPADPAMAAPAPEMFGPLTLQETDITQAHLKSGWTKQRFVYPALSEPWKETAWLLRDLDAAWWTRFRAEHSSAGKEAEAG